jgi:hypothetical protein
MAKRKISKKSVRKIKRRRKRSTRRQRGGADKERTLTPEEENYLNEKILKNSQLKEHYENRTRGLGFNRCRRTLDPLSGLGDKQERGCQIYKMAQYALADQLGKADIHAKRITYSVFHGTKFYYPKPYEGLFHYLDNHRLKPGANGEEAATNTAPPPLPSSSSPLVVPSFPLSSIPSTHKHPTSPPSPHPAHHPQD